MLRQAEHHDQAAPSTRRCRHFQAEAVTFVVMPDGALRLSAHDTSRATPGEVLVADPRPHGSLGLWCHSRRMRPRRRSLSDSESESETETKYREGAWRNVSQILL